MITANVKFQGTLQSDEINVKLTEGVIEKEGQSFSFEQLAVDAPVSGTVYGTLLNYKGALEALGEAVNEAPYKAAPKAPILYIKPANTINSHNRPILLPEGVEALEMGAALGIVIGRTATRVSEEEALDYVAGYTVVNDVSIPHESVYRPAIRQKARDGFCPIGPWIVKREAVQHPDQVHTRVYINGELRQENTTANLIRPVAKLLADVTDFMTLRVGDTLLVGVPEEAPLAKAGDVVRIEIEGVGVLENTIVPEKEPAEGGLK
ncbi:fumarylacetoacetate hydrolase family protein [Pseudobacillus wudalianchiensis]|uniref:4-hydroxyphenylacetate isomerase n=1 Tax=Pseudobacillus wudalianchiensis TaxID=1743143 RepID=A0A1B9ABU9_9BACI|nr:fumarylacetoacetate hydrolase family protein [Bacillus wudalianchiensis]OCA81323.1 4-hydroxyphenylacetate isomerase [Bacillus wudalianchiensis]